MAIVSLVALLVALGLAALINLQPWAAQPVPPRLSVAPGLGVALGDSVAVSPGTRLAVAPAQPATGGEASFVANKGTGGEGASQSRLAVAPARAVGSPRAVGPPESSPEPVPSEPLPAPQPSPAPVTEPVATPAPPPSSEPIPPPTRVVGEDHPPGPIGAGVVEGGVAETVEVHDGDEKAFSFSFYIEPTVYLAPGAENLIMRFKGSTGELPSLGLQLWDDGGGQRGLWASGDAMGGERFLAPVEEGAWHEAVIDFGASSEGGGFYLLLLDGQPIDARAWVSLIESGSSSTLIETGLFRDGEPVIGSPDIFFGPTRLADSLESVIP